MNKVLVQGYLFNPHKTPPIVHTAISLDLDDVRVALYDGVREELGANGRHRSDPSYKAQLLSIGVYFKRLEAPMYIYFINREDADTAWNLIAGVKPVEKSPTEKFPFSGFNVLVRRGYECDPEWVAIKDYIQMAYPCAIRLDMNLLPGVNILVMDGPTTVGSTIEQVMDYCRQLP